MSLKRLAALSVLSLGATVASAGGGPLDLSSGSAGFSESPVTGGFTDIYTFTVTTLSVANASVTSVVNGLQDVDFTSIVLSGPGGVFSFSLLNPDPVELWALPAAGALLSAGAYTLTLLGTNSAAGGSYGGNIAITPTSAVPEAGSLALMLAGLGALGFMARRRRGN